MAWCSLAYIPLPRVLRSWVAFFHNPILCAYPTSAVPRLLWGEWTVPGFSVLATRGETEEIGGRYYAKETKLKSCSTW